MKNKDAATTNGDVYVKRTMVVPKYLSPPNAIMLGITDQYYVKNLKTLWHTATYVYNSPLRCTLQHLADDIENS